MGLALALVAYLVKEIENNHVVWFEKSNQWVVLDEPLWFICLLYEKQTGRDAAARQFAEAYKMNPEQAAEIVANIYDSIDNLLNPDFPLPDFSIQSEEARNFEFLEKRTCSYSFYGKQFSITYGSPFLKNYFHVPLAHLESEKTKNLDFHADVFPFQGRFALRIKGGECFTADESSQIKRLLYIELASLFYGIKPEQWLTLLHASALRKGDEVLALSSASGSGKSTMASLLYARQCDFISDDFVPVDVSGHWAYPFPAAICLKDEIPDIVLNQFPELNRKSISGHQYIYPAMTGQTSYGRIKKIVFIRYKPEEENQITTVPVITALKLYLQESWVTGDPKYVEAFLNWFMRLEFYELVYGNEEKAVLTLLDLFEK